MASIRQYQRRAIEELFPFRDGKSFKIFPNKDRFFLIDGTPLYFVGLSEGIGTCSDIHGMGVAVFSFNPPPPLLYFNLQNLFHFYTGNCEYGVLLSDASEEECRIAGRDLKLSDHGCVRLLKLKKIGDRLAVFSLTNQKSVYPILA